MFIIGQSAQTIDAVNLRNNVLRLNSKLRVFVENERNNLPVKPEEIKGYATEEKLNSLFNNSAEALRVQSFQALANDLQRFLEPFARDKDTIENINQALKDITGMALKANFSEGQLNRVLDVCGKTYIHEKSDGLVQEDTNDLMSREIISGLLDVFLIKVKEEVYLPNIELRDKLKNIPGDFVAKAKDILGDGAPPQAEPQKVVNIADQRNKQTL